MRVTYLRTTVFAALIMLSSPAYAAEDVGWRPTLPDVAALERVLVLPEGAHEFQGYTRYYVGVMEDGHRMIYGLLFFTANGDPHHLGKPGEVHIVPRNDLPIVDEDRCYGVVVVFDADTKTIEETWCSGGAR